MAGCEYSFPTKENVLTEMKSAFRTLANYLEVTTPDEEIPEIYRQLLAYINKEKPEDPPSETITVDDKASIDMTGAPDEEPDQAPDDPPAETEG